MEPVLFLLIALCLTPITGFAEKAEIVAMEDAFVISSDPGGNYGSVNELLVQVEGYAPVDTARSFLKFDLSCIPPGATIDLAYLYVYDSSTGGYEIVVQEVADSWTESGITWQGQPAFNPAELCEIEEPDPNGWLYADLTPTVATWHATPAANQGIVLKYSYEDFLMDSRVFRSREYAAYEPHLVVIYDSDSQVLSPTGDAYVSNQSPDGNYGTSTTLQVGGPGGSYRRSYLQFDLSGIPADATIELARVRMYHYSGTGGGGYRDPAHRVTGSWNQSTITWNNKPAHNGTAECYRGPVGTVFLTGWLDWVVTDMVEGWQDGTYSNYGVVIKHPNEIPQGANRIGSFRSEEYGTAAYRPRLEVYYTTPPPDDYAAKQSLTGVIDSDAAWGDFDGDGDLDLVICGETDTGRVTRTYENQIDSLLLRQELVGIDGAGSGCLAWGDYDIDGDLDLAMAGTADTGRVALVFENDGAGNLSRDLAQVLTPVANASLAWGDFDRDGDLDLYLQGHDGAAPVAILYENDSLGTLGFHTALTGLYSGSADWADWNGDGYVDLLVTGSDGANRNTIFYKNDMLAGLMDDGSHGLPGFVFSDAAWGDCDNDGDLDLAITGESGSGGPRHALIYANDGGGVLDSIAEPWQIYRSSCAWGDYDNDGDLDLALCGYDGGWLMTDLFENTGSSFDRCYFSYPGVREGSVSFADADLDGDLDFFVTGADWTPKYARLYAKTGGATNTAPTAPTTFESRQYVSQFGWPDDVVLGWDGASDAETQSAGLYYLLRVGTTPGGADVVSGTYSTPLMGNVGPSKEVTLSGLPVQTYYWSVKSIDAGFLESAWSPEQVCLPRELDRVTVDPSDDAFVESFNANTPYGATTPNWLVVGGYMGAGTIARSYLKFYVGPEIPPGTDVVAAGLTVELMSVSCGSSYYIDVYGEGNDIWDENTITWNNAPTWFKPYASDRLKMTAPGPYTWDVTGDVQGTVDGNVTLVLRSGSPGEGTTCLAEYYSKDWYEAARRPVLTIWYASVYTGVADGAEAGSNGGGAPSHLVLENNRPNPFNPTTTISFALPSRGDVGLSIYDISGRLVRTLHRGVLNAGNHEVVWNGRSSSGAPSASGVYFYKLVAGKETFTKKMTLIR